jgi:hypothetical protein
MKTKKLHCISPCYFIVYHAIRVHVHGIYERGARVMHYCNVNKRYCTSHHGKVACAYASSMYRATINDEEFV